MNISRNKTIFLMVSLAALLIVIIPFSIFEIKEHGFYIYLLKYIPCVLLGAGGNVCL